jgi:hypothetical protein
MRRFLGWEFSCRRGAAVDADARARGHRLSTLIAHSGRVKRAAPYTAGRITHSDFRNFQDLPLPRFFATTIRERRTSTHFPTTNHAESAV